MFSVVRQRYYQIKKIFQITSNIPSIAASVRISSIEVEFPKLQPSPIPSSNWLLNFKLSTNVATEFSAKKSLHELWESLGTKALKV